MKKRRQARQYALQALYEWQLSGTDPESIAARYLSPHPDDSQAEPFDRDYFQVSFLGTTDRVSDWDDCIAPYLTRPLENLTPIEHAILRLATWELTERLEIPYKVILNEAVELAKLYGAADAHKFINGVLDPLSAEIRKAERA